MKTNRKFSKFIRSNEDKRNELLKIKRNFRDARVPREDARAYIRDKIRLEGIGRHTDAGLNLATFGFVLAGVTLTTAVFSRPVINTLNLDTDIFWNVAERSFTSGLGLLASGIVYATASAIYGYATKKFHPDYYENLVIKKYGPRPNQEPGVAQVAEKNRVLRFLESVK